MKFTGNIDEFLKQRVSLPRTVNDEKDFICPDGRKQQCPCGTPSTDQDYEIEEIYGYFPLTSQRRLKGKPPTEVHYLLSFTGYSPAHDCYVPISFLDQASKSVKQFHKDFVKGYGMENVQFEVYTHSSGDLFIVGWSLDLNLRAEKNRMLLEHVPIVISDSEDDKSPSPTTPKKKKKEEAHKPKRASRMTLLPCQVTKSESNTSVNEISSSTTSTSSLSEHEDEKQGSCDDATIPQTSDFEFGGQITNGDEGSSSQQLTHIGGLPLYVFNCGATDCSAQEPVLEHEQDVTPEPVLEREKDATPEPVLERNQDVTPEPVLEREKDATPEPVLEREKDATPEPVLECEREPTAERKRDPVPETARQLEERKDEEDEDEEDEDEEDEDEEEEDEDEERKKISDELGGLVAVNDKQGTREVPKSDRVLRSSAREPPTLPPKRKLTHRFSVTSSETGSGKKARNSKESITPVQPLVKVSISSRRIKRNADVNDSEVVPGGNSRMSKMTKAR